MWISGPRGDLPPQMRPRSTAVILTMRETADADPATVRKVVAALSDFVEALDSRPNEVKAAVAKVMPNLDAATLDLVFPDEAVAWKAKPLTSEDLTHEINYVKTYAATAGTLLPQIDSVTPATLLYP
jgi:ABC-type nitrate/sulfonate/bicarbonate transport system substrate-binding protein